MKKKASNPVLELGDVEPSVYDNLGDYRQTILKGLYQSSKGKVILFTITPVCQYQIDHQWPEPSRFVNVNLHGSKETTKENWIGWIPVDFSGVDLESIVSINGNVDVYGKITRDSPFYKIELMISERYSDLTFYVQHAPEQFEKLADLARTIDDYYIETEIDRRGDKYVLYYEGEEIGSVSTRKIDEWLNGDEIYAAKLRISDFNYYSDKKPFTTASLTKAIHL